MGFLMTPLSDYGRLKKGDSICIHDAQNNVQTTTVKEVLNSGTDREEIIICKRRNLYFITDNFLRGTSWVKGCSKVTVKPASP